MDSPPHGHALRKGRFSESGRIYLITTVTASRAHLFSDVRVGRLVVEALRHCATQGYAQTLAFVVMPDHLHWLLSLGNTLSLSQTVGVAKGRSARAMNPLLAEQGKAVRAPLWQKGYHDHAVRCEEDLTDLARYVVANPVRAGIVGRIADYPLWDAVWL